MLGPCNLSIVGVGQSDSSAARPYSWAARPSWQGSVEQNCQDWGRWAKSTPGLIKLVLHTERHQESGVSLSWQHWETICKFCRRKSQFYSQIWKLTQTNSLQFLFHLEITFSRLLRNMELQIQLRLQPQHQLRLRQQHQLQLQIQLRLQPQHKSSTMFAIK